MHNKLNHTWSGVWYCAAFSLVQILIYINLLDAIAFFRPCGRAAPAPRHPRLLSTCASPMRSDGPRCAASVFNPGDGAPLGAFCLDLPREPQGIIACCNPVPPLVRQQVNELHLLVQQARETPLLKVSKDGRQRGKRVHLALLSRSPGRRGDAVTQRAALFFLFFYSSLNPLQAEIATQKKKGLTPIRKVGEI